MFRMPRAKALLVVAALAVMSLSAHAGPKKTTPQASRLDVPYQISQEVTARVSTTDAWGELYRVPADQSQDALDKLTLAGQAPTPLGVIVDGALHVRMAKTPVVLNQVRVDTSRGNASISYDEECRVVPAPGDKLHSRYVSDDGNLELVIDASVLRHFAFGAESPLSREVVSLTTVGPENCALVSESRVIYEGTATLMRKGKTLSTEPVFVQSIIQ